jgi:formate dehydrogenase maturation protein FdhE
MCTCIKELENKMVGREFKNKKVESASFISAALMLSSGIVQSCSEIELEIEGQKKKGIQKVLHTYCPFCGEKYTEQ